MMSLKSFAPVLAATLGTTPAAIYERQRALIRENLLPAPIGRGRGNGLPATAETVAMILIAMMVTDNLSDTDGRVRRLAEAKVNEKRDLGHLKHQKGHCGLTGKRDFKSALVAILGSEELHSSGIFVRVSRNDLLAKIVYGREDLIQETQFGKNSGVASNLEVEASIDWPVLVSISKALLSGTKGT
jgi:hypothetical protein